MQIRSDAQAAFVRFRDQGDSAALAQVFDLVAQELLLIACHLAGPSQQPEDLLQETFLTAIRRAERYDATRPIEPWLIGILVNVTRSDRRRRGSSSMTMSEAEANLPAGDLGPGEAAEQAEFMAHLRASIAGLPLPQREVLTLHLVHGMTPTQIAHATSRPVGTVKSWIHRSIDEVRRRLPIGLVGTFAALLRGMSGLEAVRERVLTEGAGGGGAMAATSGTAAAGKATGHLLRWGVVASLAVSAIVALSLWPPGHAAQGAATAASHDARTGAGAGAPTNEQVPLRDEVVAGAGRTESTASAALTITSSTDGEGNLAWTGYLLPDHLPDPELRAVAFATDASGTARLELPAGDYLVEPDRADSVHVTLRGGEPQTVTVRLDGGVEVAGRVVDERGNGVAGAQILLTKKGHLDERFVVAASDATGAFALHRVPEGRFLAAMAPGFLPSRLVQVSAEPASSPQNLQLRFDAPGAAVTFVVVDEAGVTIPGAVVQIGNCLPPAPRTPAAQACQMRPPWLGRTDAAGRVVCEQAPLGEVDVYARAADHTGVQFSIELQAGGEYRLALAHGGRCRGTVQGAGHGLDGGLIGAIGRGVAAAATTPAWCLPRCLLDAAGHYELTGLPLGNVLVRVDGGELGWADRELQVTADTPLEWSPTLGNGRTLPGRAVVADGTPLVGHLVEARAFATRQVVAVTGDDGRFELVGLGNRAYDVALKPPKGRGALVLQRLLRLPPDAAEAALVVPSDRAPSARLRGRLDGAPVRRIGLLEATFGTELGVDVAADGSFEFAAVPPGRYHLFARGVGDWLVYREMSLAANAFEDLGTLVAAPTAALRIVLADDEHRVDQVHAHTADGSTMLAFGMVRGPVTELVVPLGTRLVTLFGGGNLLAQRRIEVTAATGELRFAIAERKATILARPALPVTDLQVVWTVAGEAGRIVVTTYRGRGAPPTGAAELALRLAPGTYTVGVEAIDGTTASGTLSIPFEGQAPALELTLR